MRAFVAGTIVFFLVDMALAAEHRASVRLPDLPDRLIVEAYQRAATQNVLAAVNPKVFPGYWSVCATAWGSATAIRIPPWTAIK